MLKDHNVSRNVVVVAEAAFAEQSWAVGLRPDQRGFLQVRDASVEFPFDTRNTAVVRLGQTVVTATVECHLVEPSPFQPRHGFLEFFASTNLTDNGSGIAPPLKKYALRHRNVLCQHIVKRLEAMIKQGKAIDTESLCVLPGRSVWSVRVDVCILVDDGNADDAAMWAAMAALLHVRRPEVSIRGDEVIVHPPHERDPIPLSVHHVPLPITSGVVAAESSSLSAATESFVVDPTLAEAAASSAIVSVAMNAEDQVCHIAKEGGCDASYALMKTMISNAQSLYPKLRKMIDDAMADHDKRRKDAMRSQFQWAQTRTGVASKGTPADAAATATGEGNSNNDGGEDANASPRVAKKARVDAAQQPK